MKDPAAVDFLEKSMIVLTSGTSENPLNLPAQKDVIMFQLIKFIFALIKN